MNAFEVLRDSLYFSNAICQHRAAVPAAVIVEAILQQVVDRATGRRLCGERIIVGW